MHYKLIKGLTIALCAYLIPTFGAYSECLASLYPLNTRTGLPPFQSLAEAPDLFIGALQLRAKALENRTYYCSDFINKYTIVKKEKCLYY
jgi:hypothetical protein